MERLRAIERKAEEAGDPRTANDARQRQRETYHESIEKHLESATGPNWLKQPELARMVAETLRHFDGDRYELMAWCVMPNHVHAIVKPLGGHSIGEILKSWKSFSAREANRMLGRSGAFWQPESYDHLIRDEDDYWNQLEYILRHKTEWRENCLEAGGGQDARATTEESPPAVGGGQNARATIPLATLVPLIDWTPFFHAWELRGVWDRAAGTLKTRNPEAAAEAAKLHTDALAWLERIIAGNRFTARAALGFHPANADGDDIIVWSDASRSTPLTRFHTLRQQTKKDSGKPNTALADWVAPVAAVSNRQANPSSAPTDHLGAFVVGIHGADALAAELDAAHDPYGSIMVKALADRLAEAAAEWVHQRARVAWGIEADGERDPDQLIAEDYPGIRPAPGYPAQPDHTEKRTLFELLDATAATCVELTESCAMHPGAAVCGLIFSHPESHYFAISELQRDQIEDYASRKGMTVAEVEKWLGPWLGYTPEGG
jgi:REP element-mobilizing transposase RayT